MQEKDKYTNKKSTNHNSQNSSQKSSQNNSYNRGNGKKSNNTSNKKRVLEFDDYIKMQLPTGKEKAGKNEKQGNLGRVEQGREKFGKDRGEGRDKGRDTRNASKRIDGDNRKSSGSYQQKFGNKDNGRRDIDRGAADRREAKSENRREYRTDDNADKTDKMHNVSGYRKDSYDRKDSYNKYDNIRKDNGFKKEGSYKKEESYKKDNSFMKDDNYKKNDNYIKNDRYKKNDSFQKSSNYDKKDDVRYGSKDRYKDSNERNRSTVIGNTDRMDRSFRDRKGNKEDGFKRDVKNQKDDNYQKDNKYQKEDKYLNENKYQKEDKFQKDEKYHKDDRNRNNGKYQSENKPTDKRKNAASSNICPVIYKCGGCRHQHISYEQQLKEKQKKVEELLSKYSKVDQITGMKDPYHYRNKVHAVFDHDKKGNPISGVYEPGTHRVVPVETCLIEDLKADAIIGSIRGLLKSFKIKTYDEDTGYGLLRHVLVRTGFHSGEIMVVLVLASPILPSKNNFVKALRQIHPEITTIVINVNEKDTSMVLGDKEQVIYGKGYIEDTLCEKVFRISPKSFYQVNPVQTEILYKKAISMASLLGDETIIDAYCGIGTIGLIASEHVKKVIGVELNKDAVRDAVINTKRNEVNNVEIYSKDAGEFMTQMALVGERIDVVFMDPPRAGSDEQFLSSLVLLKPRKVVYISCNPVTLERDLQYLTKKGYKAEKIVPVDMFPWTEHVETVVLMSRIVNK